MILISLKRKWTPVLSWRSAFPCGITGSDSFRPRQLAGIEDGLEIWAPEKKIWRLP